MTCRGEISTRLLDNSEIILVNHHIPSPGIKRENILEIIDYRPSTFNSNATSVGSCATVIAGIILRTESNIDYSDVLRLLYGAIILENDNLFDQASPDKVIDTFITDSIEAKLQLTKTDRNELFTQLFRARCDIDMLDSLHLLLKDYRIIANESETVTVATPLLVILVKVLHTMLIFVLPS